MAKNKTSISISIDLRDEFETALLKHVESQVNKSRYIKRLIYADMMGVTEAVQVVQVEEERDEDENIKAMKDFF